jgi:hypothetical protein
LAAVVANRNSRRARIILATAEGCGTAEIMRRTRDLETLRVALARAVHARGGCRPAARQDAQTRSAAIAVGRR